MLANREVGTYVEGEEGSKEGRGLEKGKREWDEASKIRNG